mmetsp:Transcript_178511/g.572044  ORF Transcript_178511/g.572044 Transcript_178511/m.572044 type:complete len:276 (-) Transcript_178511:20-847(-)
MIKSGRSATTASAERNRSRRHRPGGGPRRGSRSRGRRRTRETCATSCSRSSSLLRPPKRRSGSDAFRRSNTAGRCWDPPSGRSSASPPRRSRSAGASPGPPRVAWPCLGPGRTASAPPRESQRPRRSRRRRRTRRCSSAPTGAKHPLPPATSHSAAMRRHPGAPANQPHCPSTAEFLRQGQLSPGWRHQRLSSRLRQRQRPRSRCHPSLRWCRCRGDPSDAAEQLQHRIAASPAAVPGAATWARAPRTRPHRSAQKAAPPACAPCLTHIRCQCWS